MMVAQLKSETTMTTVVAEISIRQVDHGWFTWAVFSPGKDCHAQEGHGTSGTEALYRAVDMVRGGDSPLSGALAIYAPTGKVARAPLWAVPPFEMLSWEPCDPPVTP